MKKVHHASKTGAVDCNAGRRWMSCDLTSTRGWKLVTCLNCLRLAMLLLVFPVLSFAQQPQPLQIVSNCVKSVYDECQFVPPHWYYLKNGIWTRDDGMVGKPPAVPVIPCPADSVTKLQTAQPKVIVAMSGLRLNKSNDSPWNLHFWTSSAVFLGGSLVDWASSRGRRELGPLRNSTDGLNGKTYWGLNGGLYTLSVIIQRRHPRGASVIRDIIGTVHFGDATWNWSTQ
jgi:hypothetical protein